MKKIGKILLVCILFLGVVSFVREDTVEAAVGGTFKVKIVNVLSDGTNQEIDCEFKITKEATADEKGEVSLGRGTSAIASNTQGKIKIPSEVVSDDKAYIVTSIGQSAFAYCRTLADIEYANNISIESIGNYAFQECTSLSSTGLSGNTSVKTIGINAFDRCQSLTSTGLENNESIKTLGAYAFYRCIKLTSTGLESNKGIETLENLTFADCDNLTDTGLSKNEKIKTIKNRVFAECDAIENTGLAENKSIKNIGESVFESCFSLTSTGLATNENVESIGSGAFKNCINLEYTGLDTNKGLTSLGYSAFEGCTSLLSTGLESNNNLEELEGNMFNGCTKLTRTGLETNTSIKTLGNEVFCDCTSLESTGLDSNSSVEFVGDSSFMGCSSLTSTGLENNTSVKNLDSEAYYENTLLIRAGLGVSSKVETLGYGVFRECSNLKAFYFMGRTIPDLDSDVFPTDTVLYYQVGTDSTETDKLIGTKKPYDVLNVEAVSTSLQETYQVGQEFKLDGVKFNVTLGDTSRGTDVNCDFAFLYDNDKDNFTYTPVTLVKGVNTISGKYQGKDFSFEVHAGPLEFDVTVKNGTTDKVKYEVGETVTITANAPESGKTFKNWKVESGGVTLADANKKTTTFVMPKSAVVVEAQYEAASVPPVVEEPEIIIGAGFTYQINKNKDMEVTCSGKLEDLMEVYVDGVILNKDHYTLRSGSTIITLKASYLNTLTVGKHTLKLQYKGDVSAETYFLIASKNAEKEPGNDIEEVEKEEGTKTPSTGDRTMVGLWMMSMLCTGGYIVYRCKKKHGNIEEL